jgi:hypothetical protein
MDLNGVPTISEKPQADGTFLLRCSDRNPDQEIAGS